jgi:hypothetical protein
MNSRKTSLALLAAATWVAAGCSNNSNSPPDVPMAPNQAPTIAAIADVTTNQDTVVGPLDFVVGDDTTPANQLTVTAMVDGTMPFPADGVTLEGSGSTRSLTLTPLESATGTANVTISAVDAQGLMTTRAFSILVNARTASVRDAVLSTFAKMDGDEATPLNGFTFTQDADDPAAFAALVGEP